MGRAVTILTAAVLVCASACGKGSNKDDDDKPLPNAGIIPPAVPASGPMFEDHQQRYTINAPGVWEVKLVGNPPNLLMANPKDRSVQIVIDFGAGIDLEGAKELAAKGITRPGISLMPTGDGQWWRRDGAEGWGLSLEGTSSEQPIQGYLVWLVGPQGALAIVGAGPPAKKDAIRELVESVANSVVFGGPGSKTSSGGTLPSNLVGTWLFSDTSSTGKTTRTKTITLCADGRFFGGNDKITSSPSAGGSATAGTAEAGDAAGTWSATGGGKKGTLALSFSEGEPQNEPYETRGATLSINELAFERQADPGTCR